MDDERLIKINQEKQNAINNNNNVYNELLQDNQNLYNQQQNYAEQYEKTQNEALDKQLAFNEQKINQQKEIARENKAIEERKALNDYTSFNNKYGYEAESFAAKGLLNSGVSETSKLGGFNTYQNRLASANKAMQAAFTEYDNDMNQARLTNDVQKAQNALNKLQMQLQYSENFYNNKSNLTQTQLTNNQDLDNNYYNRYQTEYSNIQAEKQRAEAIRQWEVEMAEKQRQYNENMAFQKAQADRDQANWEKEYALSKQKASASSVGALLGGSNTEVNTPYYQGTLNPDVQYGTFASEDKNGVRYQPNNVNGQKLSKSGKSVGEALGKGAIVGSTGANLDNQNLWMANGKYYVWDGSQNKYIDVSSLFNGKTSTPSSYKNGDTSSASSFYQKGANSNLRKW